MKHQPRLRCAGRLFCNTMSIHKQFTLLSLVGLLTLALGSQAQETPITRTSCGREGQEPCDGAFMRICPLQMSMLRCLPPCLLQPYCLKQRRDISLNELDVHWTCSACFLHRRACGCAASISLCQYIHHPVIVQMDARLRICRARKRWRRGTQVPTTMSKLPRTTARMRDCAPAVETFTSLCVLSMTNLVASLTPKPALSWSQLRCARAFTCPPDEIIASHTQQPIQYCTGSNVAATVHFACSASRPVQPSRGSGDVL